jgi:ABC-type multidrug transport system ATPase subunit
MAMLHKGELAYYGSPEGMISQVRGHVWEVTVDDQEFHQLKNKFPVISTVPSGISWETQLIALEKPHPDAVSINPNLEHAYVFFMENKLGISLV